MKNYNCKEYGTKIFLPLRIDSYTKLMLFTTGTKLLRLERLLSHNYYNNWKTKLLLPVGIVSDTTTIVNITETKLFLPVRIDTETTSDVKKMVSLLFLPVRLDSYNYYCKQGERSYVIALSVD